jgi:tetratricopeptide (TPR) repeat protein
MTRMLNPDFKSVLSVVLLVLQLAAPRSNLVAIHWPDLSNVEAEARGQLLKAQASLTTAVNVVNASDATLSEAYASMGQTFHAYSFNAPARECYVNASRLAPKDFRWVYLTAKLDQQDGRFDEAIKNYLLAQSLNPSYVAASINLGNIFLEANRLAEAHALSKEMRPWKNSRELSQQIRVTSRRC